MTAPRVVGVVVLPNLRRMEADFARLRRVGVHEETKPDEKGDE